MAKKYALLIGNTDYKDEHLPQLSGSLVDIKSVAAVLNNRKICGFDEVIRLPNPTFSESMRALSQLFANKTKDELLLFYFSGHGVKDHAGDLFFAIKETEHGLYDGTAIAASLLKNIVNKSGSHRQVLILDCCHSGAITQGLKGIDTMVTTDTFDVTGYGCGIIAATRSHQYAADSTGSDESSQRSLFTHFLVEGLETGAAADESSDTVTVEQLYQYVHKKVTEVRPGMQPVYICDQSIGRIGLAKNPRQVFKLPEDLMNDLVDANPRTRIGVLRELNTIVVKGDERKRAAVQNVLSARMDEERDRFVHQEIEQLLTVLSEVTADTVKPERISVTRPENTDSLDPGRVFSDTLKDGSNGPEMMVIPAGKFRMGDISGNGDEDEKPVHEVKIERLFALGKYPVSFAEYDYYCDQTGVDKPGDEDWGRNDRPVINVSWNDAVAYIEWLREQTGKRYRLPSEAEWEYAARGGTDTAYWWGDEADKNLANFSGKKTNPVKKFKANLFGLHDTLGNVWEWVQDTWHENYQSAPCDGSAWLDDELRLRVLRGGSWYSEPNYARSAFRNRDEPEYSNYNVGFRLAQDL